MHRVFGQFLSRIFFALSMAVVPTLDARIGETPIQFVDRYGAPKDTAADKSSSSFNALVEGAIHHTYEYQGWKIRAAFLQVDGPAVRMDYQKIAMTGVNPKIQDFELQAIISANTPTGMTWKKIMYNNPDLPGNAFQKFAQGYFAGAIGEKMWQRSDGAILWLRSNLIVRLELPAAREYEAQLKATKDKKARESVPQFYRFRLDAISASQFFSISAFSLAPSSNLLSDNR